MLDIKEYWRLTLAKRTDDLRPFLRQDLEVHWHNTNEKFDLEQYLQVIASLPGGRWQADFWLSQKTGNGVQTVMKVTPKGRKEPAYYVNTFFTFRKSKILFIDMFWGEMLPAADWRKEKGLGEPLVIEEAPEAEPLPVVIRGAVHEDFPAVQALVKLELDRQYENRPDYFQWGMYSQKEYDDLLVRNGAIAWVAELEGRVVGVCLGKIGKTPESELRKGRKIAIIQDLAVVRKQRRKGIAKALLAEVRDQAARAGAVSIEMNVWDFSQEAVGLCRKLGIKPQYHRFELPLR